MLILTFLLFLRVCTTSVQGHALLTEPASKNGGTLSTPLNTPTQHFALASYGIIDKAFFDKDHSKTPWKRPGEFNFEMARDLIPGHPQTLHPCGCNAGSVEHCAGVISASGFGDTTLGGKVNPPLWEIGSYQKTAWNSWANHGGGYIYMLCKKTDFDTCRDTLLPKKPAQGNPSQKEAYLSCVWKCFESNVLEWAPEPQKLQFQDDSCTYASMDYLEKSDKNGHIWRYTPIPDTLQVTNGGEGACMWESLKGFSNDKAKDEFIASFGTKEVCDSGKDSHTPYNWHVKDKVKVPTDLEAGEYLLSWRWDAYMADQMWTNCADVKIIASSSTETSSVSTEVACTAIPTSQPIEPIPTNIPTPAVSSPTKSPAVSPPTKSPALVCPSAYTGLRPHDFCKKYFHCVNGKVEGDLYSCTKGTLFDVDLQYCNYQDKVTCQTETEGCYSNNYKDCNHPDFQSKNDSCNTIWIPNGSRQTCVALWGKCDKNNKCCEPAVCHGDSPYAQCIPPESPPTSSPTQGCISCNDKEDKAMIKRGKKCATSSKYIKKKCNKLKSWKKKKFCQLSCFSLGLGYDGDVCCDSNSLEKFD